MFSVFHRWGGSGDDGGKYSEVVDGELGLVTLWTCDDRVAGAGEVALSACWHPPTGLHLHRRSLLRALVDSSRFSADRVLNVLNRTLSTTQHTTGCF